MSKEAWFRHYETFYNEREAGEIEGSDELLSELAFERESEEMAARADLLHDEAKEGLR